MNFLLKRSIAAPPALPGELSLDGHHAAYTLERTDVAIPAGTYRITLYPSPHFQMKMPMLEDVPGRSYILIHWGNYAHDSDGCILVGETYDPSSHAIYNTRKKWHELMPAIEGAIDAGESCWISVVD